MGQWQGSIFNNTEHMYDISLSFPLSQEHFIKASIWKSAKNTENITMLSDAFLGVIRVTQEENKNYTFTFLPPNSPDQYILEVSKKVFKNSYFNSSFPVRIYDNILNSSFYLSKMSAIYTVFKDNYSIITVNAFHTHFPVIPTSEKINFVIYVLIGSCLGGICIILWFSFFFEGRNNQKMKQE